MWTLIVLIVGVVLPLIFLKPVPLRVLNRRAARMLGRARGCQHGSGQVQLGGRFVYGIARLDRHLHRHPRLVAWDGYQRGLPLAHAGATPPLTHLFCGT